MILNGSTLTVNGVTYDQPTLYSGDSWSGPATDCYEITVDLSTCIDVTYNLGTDTYPTENSWAITDADGNTLASGGNTSGTFGDCGVAILDAAACNYNVDATTDDGSVYKILMDVVSLLLLMDMIVMVFVYVGTTVTMGGGSYLSETSWSITDCDGNTLASGSGNVAG